MEIFEAMLQLSGETLLFNMHSNVFDLPKNHAFKNSDYLKNDVEIFLWNNQYI